jgi:hypothetical protein
MNMNANHKNHHEIIESLFRCSRRAGPATVATRSADPARPTQVLRGRLEAERAERAFQTPRDVRNAMSVPSSSTREDAPPFQDEVSKGEA